MATFHFHDEQVVSVRMSADFHCEFTAIMLEVPRYWFEVHATNCRLLKPIFKATVVGKKAWRIGAVSASARGVPVENQGTGGVMNVADLRHRSGAVIQPMAGSMEISS